MVFNCYTAVGHLSGPKGVIGTDKIPTPGELNLGPQNCEWGVQTTGSPQQAILDP